MAKFNVMAFDKNSNAFLGQTIEAESKEEFNQKFEEFEKEIPFSKFYTEIDPIGFGCDTPQSDWDIICDHEHI